MCFKFRLHNKVHTLARPRFINTWCSPHFTYPYGRRQLFGDKFNDHRTEFKVCRFIFVILFGKMPFSKREPLWSGAKWRPPFGLYYFLGSRWLPEHFKDCFLPATVLSGKGSLFLTGLAFVRDKSPLFIPSDVSYEIAFVREHMFATSWRSKGFRDAFGRVSRFVCGRRRRRTWSALTAFLEWARRWHGVNRRSLFEFHRLIIWYRTDRSAAITGIGTGIWTASLKTDEVLV